VDVPKWNGVPFRWYLVEMSRVCTVCTHPQAAAVDEALAAGTSYRQVAASWGLKLSAVFRHANNHLTDPIQRRPCDICGQPLVADEQRRHAGCRKLAQRRATERGYAAVGARKAADAWLFKADARWSSLPELRRQRQAAGLCVVCAHDRPADRHWCCSREHEKLRQHTLHRVLNE
jgi:hypothetical protein